MSAKKEAAESVLEGDYDAAARRYVALADQAPSDGDLQWSAAMALQAAGQDRAAIARKRRYLRLVPTDAAAWADLGVHLAKMGEAAEAKIALERAAKLDADAVCGEPERAVYASLCTNL